MATTSRGRTRSTEAPEAEAGDDAAGPSKSQVRELRRRVRDLEDRTRYLLVSVFTARVTFYYNVSTDTFGMNDPSLGTLFKRRAAAIAIQRLLRTGIQVVECRADRRDRVVKSSLPRLRPTWRRSLVRPRRTRSRARRA